MLETSQEFTDVYMPELLSDAKVDREAQWALHDILLTSFGYKGSYSASKGGEMYCAPSGSPVTGPRVHPAKFP